MLGAIRYFISLSVITFVIGLFANLVTLFVDKILKASSQTITAVLSPDTIEPRFSSWEADPAARIVSFSVRTENLDLNNLISKEQKDAVRLVVAVRPRSVMPNDKGTYPKAFGPYPVGAIPPQRLDLGDEARQILSGGCVDFVLFKVPKAEADKRPLTVPFNPSDYGSEVRVLNRAYDGQRCP